MKYGRHLTVGVLISSIFAACCSPFGSGGGRGREVESWEASNHVFRIRVTEYQEDDPVYLTRFFYNFKAAPVSSHDWSEITTVVSDDDIPLPREQVRFVSDRVGYFFMLSTYAVTTDGGSTWSVSDVRKDFFGAENNYVIIKDVDISLSGIGTMRLSPTIPQQKNFPALHTTDYGLHWVVK